MSETKTMNFQKHSTQIEYLNYLEFLRRVMEEDLNPVEGSAAEIRSNGDAALEGDLDQVTQWQTAVEQGDAKQAAAMAEGIEQLFRSYRRKMGYPQYMLEVHQKYMRVVHGLPGRTLKTKTKKEKSQ